MGNIVWIASFPKSGNTWMRLFIANYLANGEQPININTLHEKSLSEANSFHYLPFLSSGQSTMDLDTQELCRLRSRAHAQIAAEAHGTTFVKTHNFLGEYKGCPLHNNQVTSGTIYIVRNPLDIVVSMSNYFNYSIDDAIDFMSDEMTGTPNEADNIPQIISSWSGHVNSWTQHAEESILVVRYEDMLANPLKAFRKVESFLKLKKDPRRLRKAIKFSSFEQTKAQEKKSGFTEKYENTEQFFRKGQKNQWRDVLSTEQLERITQNHAEMMKKYKYL